ncbi:MAG: diguanylate cyclase [Magnetospirillum sp.]|nr:diguanylate cyclase [Magnetospirillum sp.]
MGIWKVIPGVLLVAFNLTLYLLLDRQHRNIVAETRIKAESVAVLLEVAVSEFIEGTQRTLTGLTHLVMASGVMDNKAEEERVRFFMAERRRASPSLTAILAFDTQGNLRLHSEDASFASTNVADRPYFQYHQHTPDLSPLLGPALRNRSSGAWVVPISQRIESEDGRFAGVMVTGLSPKHFVGLFESLASSDYLVITMRHADGSVLASFPSLTTAENIPAPVMGENAVVVRRHSSRYPLVIEVGADLDKRLSDWRHDRDMSVILALAGSLVIVVGAGLLNQAASRRRQFVDDLAQANTLLEQRVEERTKELKSAFNRLNGFLGVARDAVVIIDKIGTIEEFNPAAEAMFGYAAPEVVGKSINMLMPESYAASHDRYIAHSQASQAAHKVGGGREMVGRRKDGSEFPIELTVGTHRDGEAFSHVGVIRDISERKQAEAKLTLLATTDGLTGLLNRRAFMEQATRRLADTTGQPAAVMMIDADHFKRINDTYGHDAGDRVLRHLADILRDCARAPDLVGRLGGEEFAFLLPQAPGDSATRVAEQILERVRACVVPLEKGDSLTFRVSIGMVSGAPAMGIDEFLSRADKALYQAKSEGRDRVVRLDGQDTPI